MYEAGRYKGKAQKDGESTAAICYCSTPSHLFEELVLSLVAGRVRGGGSSCLCAEEVTAEDTGVKFDSVRKDSAVVVVRSLSEPPRHDALLANLAGCESNFMEECSESRVERSDQCLSVANLVCA